ANIVMPYSRQASGAIDIASGLDISIIASSHGVIWRSHVKEIMDAYKEWTKCEAKEKAIVVFDSMWHSTETIAQSITETLKEKGVQVKFFDLKQNHMSDILTEVLDTKYIIVGSPTLNNNMMPTVAGFLCYLKGLIPKGRKG